MSGEDGSEPSQTIARQDVPAALRGALWLVLVEPHGAWSNALRKGSEVLSRGPTRTGGGQAMIALRALLGAVFSS